MSCPQILVTVTFVSGNINRKITSTFLCHAHCSRIDNLPAWHTHLRQQGSQQVGRSAFSTGLQLLY